MLLSLNFFLVSALLPLLQVQLWGHNTQRDPVRAPRRCKFNKHFANGHFEKQNDHFPTNMLLICRIYFITFLISHLRGRKIFVHGLHELMIAVLYDYRPEKTAPAAAAGIYHSPVAVDMFNMTPRTPAPSAQACVFLLLAAAATTWYLPFTVTRRPKCPLPCPRAVTLP